MEDPKQLQPLNYRSPHPPNPRRPRILWVGIGDGTQEVCALHDALEPPLLDLGCYRREDRQYSPHITLGRVKSDRPTQQLSAELAKQAGWKGGEKDDEESCASGNESGEEQGRGPEGAGRRKREAQDRQKVRRKEAAVESRRS